MNTTFPPQVFEGVWSATPTAFDNAGIVCAASTAKLIEHHVNMGIAGLFLAGTCGEGPWMPDGQRKRLLEVTLEANRGRLPLALQVSDNSAARIMDNVKVAVEGGADYVVIAPPRFLLNATPSNLLRLYQTAIRDSPLPVILYDLGKNASLMVPEAVLEEIYAEENVVAVKDSSADPLRRDIALKARLARPSLRLLNGDEFQCDQYMEAGYDGLMIGGAAFAGRLAIKIVEAARQSDWARATELQAKLSQMLFTVYGGKDISLWLGGEKQLLVDLGIIVTSFNFLGYTVTPEWVAATKKLRSEEAELLLG